MSHCMTGLQCNQTPLGGCIWMVSCPLSGRWQCALLLQVIMAHPRAQLSSQLKRKEARDCGFTDPPLLPPSGLAQTSSHDHTFGAIFLQSVSQTSHVFPLEQRTHMRTHAQRNMLTSNWACTQYHTQCARPTVQVRPGSWTGDANCSVLNASPLFQGTEGGNPKQEAERSGQAKAREDWARAQPPPPGGQDSELGP